jgi:diguanylate cyclase (GGDEF)-like protein
MFNRLFKTTEDIVLGIWVSLSMAFLVVLLVMHGLALDGEDLRTHWDMIVTGLISLFLMATTITWLIVSKVRLRTKTDELVKLKEDLEAKISERTQMLQEAISELEILASVDSLTQVANRRHIKNMLRDEASRAKRTGTTYSVIMLDIDHFKKVNDTLGHAVGDDVLRAVAKTCAATLRQVDRVGRIGGEEFLVVLPDASPSDAVQVAERVRKEVANLTFAQKDLKITISLGVASCDGKGSVPELLERADQALYDAKDSGRNKTCSHQIAEKIVEESVDSRA